MAVFPIETSLVLGLQGLGYSAAAGRYTQNVIRFVAWPGYGTKSLISLRACRFLFEGPLSFPELRFVEAVWSFACSCSAWKNGMCSSVQMSKEIM